MGRRVQNSIVLVVLMLCAVALIAGGQAPGKPLTKDIVEWADRILVMEDDHRSYIAAYYPSALSKVYVLGIQDAYSRENPRLKRLLEQKTRNILRASNPSSSGERQQV